MPYCCAEYSLCAGGFGGFSNSTQTDDYIDGYVELNSWEDYAAILEDDSYLASALADTPELNQSVTVYEFTDVTAPEDAADTTHLQVSFTKPNSSPILTYHITSYSWNPDTGVLHYGVPLAPTDAFSLLVFLGDEPTEYTAQGCFYDKNGEEQTADGVSATMTKSEMTLGEVLWKLVHSARAAGRIPNGVTDEMLFKSVVLRFKQNDAMSDAELENTVGRLDDAFQDALSQPRVCYQRFSVTIPAGQSVAVTASCTKGGSIRDMSDISSYCFEILTTRGSNLNFTAQTASIETRDTVEIVQQNFGFDTANGKNTVDLAITQPYYFVNVSKPVDSN